jgi:hypothetical protein
MSINPIDVQVMVLNQSIVGKEQQNAKDQPVQMLKADTENFVKESKESEEKVSDSPESEGEQKISDKERQKSSYYKNKKKKQQEEEQEKKKKMNYDPVRGRIIDLKL